LPFLNLLLAVREHAAHTLYVGVCDLQGRSELTFTLRLLFRKDVIEMGLGALEATFARLAEALGGAPIGFHLRHVVLTFGLATHRTIPAATGG